MIIFDTHVWVWWVNESEELTAPTWQLIEGHQQEGTGVSIISCWEVAKSV